MRPLARTSLIAFLFALCLSLLTLVGCGGTGATTTTTANATPPGGSGSGSSNAGSGSNSGSGAGTGSTGTGSGSGTGTGTGTGSGAQSSVAVVYVANMGASNISAFSLGADGSLTEVSGSPYSSPAANRLAISGSTLVAISGGSLLSSTASTFSIAAGGGLTHASDFPISAGTGDVVGNSSNVFVSSNDGIYSFTVSNGSLVPVAGSPFFANDPNGDSRSNVTFTRMALDPAGAYLFAGELGNHGSDAFLALPIHAGALSRDPSATPSNDTDGIAIIPMRNSIFRADANSTLEHQSFDPSSGVHSGGAGSLTPLNGIGDVVFDSSGKYLLALVTPDFVHGTGQVRVFDVSNGTPQEIQGSPFSTGGFFPSAMTFDVSGHFALIVHGSTTSGTPSNDLSVMSFDSSTGKLTLVGSPHPVNSTPTSVISGKF